MSASPSDSPRIPRRAGLALALLLVLVGGALRAWYASGELHIDRFEDERYSLANVRKIVGTLPTGVDFEPVSGYYPSPVFNLPQALALEASQRLSERLDRPTLRTYADGGVILPTGFLLTRLLQTLYGTLTVWLAFLVGRRLSSTAAGLLAAALLAFMPWLIHASGYNKPDALLAMAVLLSLHAALRALDATRERLVLEPSARTARAVGRWIWAGVAIALAMSAKLTGGFAAIPITVGALVAPGTRRQRLERLGLLVVAGVSSALTFVLLNPYWPAYLHFIRGLQRDYAGRTDASRWDIPGDVAAMHLESFFFGPILGTLALASFAVAVAWTFRGTARHVLKSHPHDERAWAWTRLAMLVSYPLVYTVAYAVQTAYFKPNNFLPTIPFTTLAFAWAVDRLAERASPSAPARALWVRGAALALALLLIVPAGWAYVANSRLPTTIDVARVQLDERLQPAAGHIVWVEEWDAPGVSWDGTRRLHGALSTMRWIDWSELSPDVASLAAATVRHLDDATTASADAWPTTERWTIEPRWLRVRGPAVEVVLRSGTRVEPVPNLVPRLCGDDCIEADLPADLEPGEVVSTFLFVPFRLLERDPRPDVVFGDVAEPLEWVSNQRGGHLFAGPRLRVPAGVESLQVQGRAPFVPTSGDAPNLDGLAIELHRWRPAPGSEPTDPATSG